MSGTLELSGKTRVVAIIGDPIAQVKSPGGVTQALVDQGRDCVVIPVHVTPADVDTYVRGASLAKNLDGIIVTVPHKFAAYKHCGTATERAHFLGAVNIMRRNADGTWHGDMVDGVGFVQGIRLAGCKPEGTKALLVGAGGAGSAIGLALLDNGVAELAVHDEDPVRRDALLARLRKVHGTKASAGTDDPTGFDVVVNATPVGMKAGDPLPVQAGKFTPGMFVGDVITVPAVTPMLAVARKFGCGTQVGAGMFAAVSTLMVRHLLEAGPLAD